VGTQQRDRVAVLARTNPAEALELARTIEAACLAPLKNGKINPKGESHLEDCLPAIARIDSDLAWDLRTRLTALRSERAARALR
jgi:hypothetical protein